MIEHSTEQFYLTPHIRHVWVDDRVVILDLLTESYFALDPTGSTMLRELVREQSRATCLRNLQIELSGDSARIEIDLNGLTRRCVEAGWLSHSPINSRTVAEAPPRGRAVQRCLALRAWCTLLHIRLSLARWGFARTYDWLARLVPPLAPRDRNADELLSVAVSAFARAEEFFYLKAAPADCLPRSLALFKFLHSVGLPVEHCIGVQQFPFTAHAWTQYYGRIIQDDPENQDRYTIIARIHR